MMEEIRDIVENGTDEERELIGLAVQAIRQKRERNSAFISGMMGLKGQFVGERRYQFLVPVTSFMNNRMGVVHGGITATLIDSTMGSLVNRSLQKGQYAVTAELKINYIRPGKTGSVRAEAEILHKGSKLVVCSASLFDERDRLIAHATGSFMVLGKPEVRPIQNGNRTEGDHSIST